MNCAVPVVILSCAYSESQSGAMAVVTEFELEFAAPFRFKMTLLSRNHSLVCRRFNEQLSRQVRMIVIASIVLRVIRAGFGMSGINAKSIIALMRLAL